MEYKYQLSQLKVAIVHDWLVSLGGAEKVVQSLLKLFPQADLYTSVYDSKRLGLFNNRKVRTSFLQRWPLSKSKHQLYASLRPLAFEGMDFQGYDLVISSSSAESKGVITPTETLHISYIHTPIRYYWSGYEDYLKRPGFGLLNPLVRMVMPRMVRKLRRWDYAAAQRPDFLIANSRTVKERIKKYYDRESNVINPPVDFDRFQKGSPANSAEYYLVVSRLVPYKRVDLAVQACKALNKRLIVAGKGPELSKLKKLAGPNTEFIFDPNDHTVTGLYRGAKALIFSAEEDFGITPVEAMSAGTPVICFGQGGATETVIDGKTGLYHSRQTVSSLTEAIVKFENMDFNKKFIVQRAEKFSEEKFLDNIGGYIFEKIQEKNK